jgi:ankyrin repeat protein
MSVITQWGESVLMEAARKGRTEVVVELVKAGANVDMQNIVCQYNTYI